MQPHPPLGAPTTVDLEEGEADRLLLTAEDAFDETIDIAGAPQAVRIMPNDEGPPGRRTRRGGETRELCHG